MNVPHAAMKILCATTKAWCSQINKYINKYFKNEAFFITLKKRLYQEDGWRLTLLLVWALGALRDMCSYCITVHPTTYSPSCSSIAIYLGSSLASHVSRFRILVISEFSKLIWKKIGLNLLDICYATSRASPVAQQCRKHTRCGLNPWVGKIPQRRTWQLTPVFLPGESHGQRILEGCSA